MKLEVGMYFRTKAGTINKIDSFTEDKSEFYFNTKPIFSDEECLGSNWGYTKDIVKASYNIIDILEVGDYVNGQKVYYDEELDFLYAQSFDANGEFYQESITKQSFIDNIKSVITHEQMEQMAYKVEE